MGYLRLVDGPTRVERAVVSEEAYEGGLLLAGDRLATARGARVELVLAETTLIRVGGDSDLVLAAVAATGDGGDPNRVPVIVLERGELVLASEGRTETRIDTDKATVYLGAGSYRVGREGGSTRLIARRGEAELRTRRGAAWIAAGEQARVEGDGLPIVELAGGANALERWAAVLDRRRERWAWCPRGSCLRGFWSFFDEDDYDAEPVLADHGSDTWDDGAPVCSDHRGGAGRTRPPRPPEEPRHAVPSDPGRWPLPSDDDRGESADDELHARRSKPWPVEEGPSDTWAVASADALTDATDGRTAQGKPPHDGESRREEDARSDDGSRATGSWAVEPAAEPGDASTSGEPSGSEATQADSPAAATDSTPADSNTSDAPAEPAPTPDSGGSPSDAAAPEAVEPPQRDPGSEPSR